MPDVLTKVIFQISASTNHSLNLGKICYLKNKRMINDDIPIFSYNGKGGT